MRSSRIARRCAVVGLSLCCALGATACTSNGAAAGALPTSGPAAPTTSTTDVATATTSPTLPATTGAVTMTGAPTTTATAPAGGAQRTSAPTRPSAPRTSGGAIGPLAALGFRPFPATDPWNTPVDTAAVDPASTALIASIGASGHLHPDFGANWDGGPFGIPYVVVPGNQKKVPVTFDYAEESDPGPYPIPSNAPIEGGAASDGDRHVIVVDRDHRRLYELWNAHPRAGGGWHAGSGAVFDLSTGARRPAGWTSADAAGLPVLPGLVRYEEVAAGRIDHALRFTVSTSRRAYVAPARHSAGGGTSAAMPPMGMRVRLKASFDLSGYSGPVRIVLQALKTYGMIVADNGSNWFISGTADRRWNDDRLGDLKNVPGSAFEVVKMGPLTSG